MLPFYGHFVCGSWKYIHVWKLDTVMYWPSSTRPLFIWPRPLFTWPHINLFLLCFCSIAVCYGGSYQEVVSVSPSLDSELVLWLSLANSTLTNVMQTAAWNKLAHWGLPTCCSWESCGCHPVKRFRLAYWMLRYTRLCSSQLPDIWVRPL